MKKSTGKASTIPMGIAIGEACSLAVVVMGSIFLAKMIELEKVPWETAGYWIMGILLLASFAGTIVSCGKIRRKKLQVSLIHASVFGVILMLITLLFFGGKYEAVGVTWLLIFGGSSASWVLMGNQRTRKRKHVYR